MYPWHDGIADEIEGDETPHAVTDEWTGPSYWEECPWDGDLEWCKRPAKRDRHWQNINTMAIPCCGGEVFPPFIETDHEGGTYELKSTLNIIFTFPGRPTCTELQTPTPEQFEGEWVSPGWCLDETNITRIRNLGWPYGSGAGTTFLKDGRGGVIWLEQYDHGTRRIIITPKHDEHVDDNDPDTCMAAGWGDVYDTGDVGGTFYNRFWKQRVRCDDTIYEISGGGDTIGIHGDPTGGYFWNLVDEENPDFWLINPRYFKMGESGLLVLPVQRWKTYDWDYWLFSPDFGIAETTIHLEHSHMAYLPTGGYYYLHLLPITAPDGESLYANGEFELIREVTPTKIQAGEV